MRAVRRAAQIPHVATGLRNRAEELSTVAADMVGAACAAEDDRSDVQGARYAGVGGAADMMK